MRRVGLGVLFRPVSLGERSSLGCDRSRLTGVEVLESPGERVSLGGDCSRLTGIGILENGGQSARPLKVKRGDSGAEGSCALGKLMGGVRAFHGLPPKILALSRKMNKVFALSRKMNKVPLGKSDRTR